MGRAAWRASHAKLWVFFELTGDFDRAFHRLFRAHAKHQRATVAGRQAHQFPSALRRAKRLRRPRDLAKFFKMLELLVNQELRVTDDVDEQNVSNFERDVFFKFAGHVYADFRSRTEIIPFLC
jgi:uncharacterized glyoxalase superfamily metalloenzyme YdcJ